MENLKFKKDAQPIGISEDFFYMISVGGWCSPEKFLEQEDAKKVFDAINIINQYEQQGHEEWFLKSEGTCELIRDVRNIIDEILKQQKNITIR